MVMPLPAFQRLSSVDEEIEGGTTSSEFETSAGFCRAGSEENSPAATPVCPSFSRRRSLPDTFVSDVPSNISHAAHIGSTGSEVQVHELIPRTLSFCAQRSNSILYSGDLHFISTRLHQIYKPTCKDFGPVDLSVVLRFCEKLSGRLQSKQHQVVCCGSDAKERANTYFLLAAFLVIEMEWSPDRACRRFEEAGVTIVPFRDASSLPATYFLSLRDCISGLWKAKQMGFLSSAAAAIASQRPTVDFVNQVCPKFVAFRGPNKTKNDTARSILSSPEHYADKLSRMGVSAVVQLNGEGPYPTQSFEARRIRHHLLPFPDGHAPSVALVDHFLDICQQERGTVGVHCMAGLGRTGTMIGAWLIRRAGFSSREAIAWLRIVRPGSVMGPQQHFLDRLAASNLTRNADSSRAVAVPGRRASGTTGTPELGLVPGRRGSMEDSAGSSLACTPTSSASTLSHVETRPGISSFTETGEKELVPDPGHDTVASRKSGNMPPPLIGRGHVNSKSGTNSLLDQLLLLQAAKSDL